MSANDGRSHETPIKTPKQLIIVLVLALVVPIALAILLAKFATSGRIYDKDSPAMSAEEIAKRLKPVADVSVGPAVGGKEPKFGDKKAWAPGEVAKNP